MKLVIGIVTTLVLVLLFFSITKEDIAEYIPIAHIQKTGLEPIEKYGKTWIPYAVVKKRNGYKRKMFVEANIVNENQNELTDGTLIAMETWFGENQSTVFVRKLENGQWLSGDFAPLYPNYKLTETISCNRCHAGASTQQDTYTRELLFKALKTNFLQSVECDKSSFSPCDLSTYK